MMLPRWTQAEDLIPEVLAFDPPSFLSVSTIGQEKIDPAGDTREIRRYAATDNDPRTSQRIVIISERKVGTGPDLDKATPGQPLDGKSISAEMTATVKAAGSVTNVSSVTHAEVGGQPAWLISYQMPRPYWQDPDSVFIDYDVYWVRVQTNHVIEVKLIADSKEHLETLKTCLPQFKITKSASPAAGEATGTTQ